MNNVVNEIYKLEPIDQLEIANSIWYNLSMPEYQLNKLEIQEIEQRYSEYLKDTSDMESADQVFLKIKQKHGF